MMYATAQTNVALQTNYNTYYNLTKQFAPVERNDITALV